MIRCVFWESMFCKLELGGSHQSILQAGDKVTIKLLMLAIFANTFKPRFHGARFGTSRQNDTMMKHQFTHFLIKKDRVRRGFL